ncbi:hypothetical protein W822_15605 [Advenella kashmirensis W13003]|uniref:Uncharacterized protein n=1 Tax=Advenella kashmirensis W13003 TaxID=1424334 RepID=V8QTT4_9BURK|nr:hypothetical protein [Advenella kashmirensis]ETF02424.1 hypothetical protein W822_15605 [Advenella kashmirensis W13003]
MTDIEKHEMFIKDILFPVIFDHANAMECSAKTAALAAWLGLAGVLLMDLSTAELKEVLQTYADGIDPAGVVRPEGVLQ